MSSVLKVDDSQFEAEVIKHDGLAVVDFGAEWCGPCKKLHPIMAELADEMPDQVKIVEVDVGVSPEIAQKYAVVSVPQILFFKNGEMVERVVGVLPKVKIIAKIETLK